MWKLFWVLCLGIAAWLLVLIHPLVPLYLDADVRTSVRSRVSEVAEQEGWLLSGLSIQSIEEDRVKLQYRSYMRVRDEAECLWVSLSSNSSLPCTD